VVVGFVDGGEVVPAEETAAGEDPAFDDAAVDWEGVAEEFVFRQEAGDVLAADVAGERLETLSDWEGRVGEGVAELVEEWEFVAGVFGDVVAEMVEGFRHDGWGLGWVGCGVRER
jgi:hypothetical protein